MISPRRWKFALAILVAAASLIVSGGAPRADVAFRKKPVAKTAPAAAEPTGGDLGTAPATDSAPAAGPSKLQAADPDAPHAEKPPAPPVLVATAPPPDPGPPVYKTRKFWLVAGAVVVGIVAVAWGGSAINHAMHGGDVKSCDPSYVACFGQGR